jgi:hypothetical protein
MPTLNIGGRSVQVDDSFLKLSSDQQNATVDEISKSFGSSSAEPSITDAVTDIPSEVGKAYSQAAQHVTGNSVTDLPGYDPRTRGQLGPIEGLMRTGKQVLGVPELLASLPTGLARSVLGHLMAQGEHAIGTVINPDAAAKDNPQAMYEAAKGDVDTAMSAARPAGMPIKSIANGLPGQGPQAAAYQWQAPAGPAVKPPVPTVGELKASATAHYESPAVVDLEVKPTAIKDYSGTAQVRLNNEGFDENLAPKTFGILSKMESVPAHATVTGQNFNTIRKMLGKAASSTDATEKAAASIAIDHLDEFIPKIPKGDVIAGDVGEASKALETARGDYSAAKQSENIDNKLISAELRAASTHSGANVANTIRQRMAAIADPTKPKEGRGLLPQEIDQAQTIAEGTPTQNALRKVSNVLGGGGGLGMLHGGSIGAALGAAVAGPAGAAVGATAVPAIGHLLKALSNKMTIRQAEQLSDAIRSRAPLASSAAKFSQAAATAQKSRTPQAMVGAMLAARNLSNNLRSSGLNFSPADLLNGLQGTVPARSENEQQ